MAFSSPVDGFRLGPVLAGYDIGSRVAQAVAIDFPERLRALVVAPPLLERRRTGSE